MAQTHARHLPVLLCIICDILAIPDGSISVEHLFSVSKYTLSNACSLMLMQSASNIIVTKEWMKLGLGHGIGYRDGVTVHQ